LQNEPSVSRLAVIALCASGCFYTDPINQRPSADIIPATSGPLYRGATIELDASTYDPEGGTVSVAWRAYACTDGTMPSGCDTDPFYTGFQPAATIPIPVTRNDLTTPVEALRVILEATDDRGATAKPAQEYLMAVDDHPPELTLNKSSRYGYVIGTPVDVFATVDDPDDGADAVTLDWKVFSPPAQPTVTLDPVTAALPHQFGKEFTPTTTGDFTFVVTASDPVGETNPQMLTVNVVPDHAPCIGSITPAAAVAPNYLPIQDATLFQVLVVSDDLDPYPTIAGDPIYRAETFAWSLKAPGSSTRQPLAIVGNAVAIDPSAYTPGDTLELRVEIQDRVSRPITCADNMDTCSVISDQSCIQRLTWRIEVQ